MPKLQACSVVAGKSDGAWALASENGSRRLNNNMNQRVSNASARRMPDAITVSSLAATGHDCVKSRGTLRDTSRRRSHARDADSPKRRNLLFHCLQCGRAPGQSALHESLLL